MGFWHRRIAIVVFFPYFDSLNIRSYSIKLATITLPLEAIFDFPQSATSTSRESERINLELRFIWSTEIM